MRRRPMRLRGNGSSRTGRDGSPRSWSPLRLCVPCSAGSPRSPRRLAAPLRRARVRRRRSRQRAQRHPALAPGPARPGLALSTPPPVTPAAVTPSATTPAATTPAAAVTLALVTLEAPVTVIADVRAPPLRRTPRPVLLPGPRPRSPRRPGTEGTRQAPSRAGPAPRRPLSAGRGRRGCSAA